MILSQTDETLMDIIKELQKKYGSALKSKLTEEVNKIGIEELNETLKRLVEKRLVNEIVPNAIYSIGTQSYCPTCVDAVQRSEETKEQCKK